MVQGDVTWFKQSASLDAPVAQYVCFHHDCTLHHYRNEACTHASCRLARYETWMEGSDLVFIDPAHLYFMGVSEWFMAHRAME